jgi:hypothetical protein
MSLHDGTLQSEAVKFTLTVLLTRTICRRLPSACWVVRETEVVDDYTVVVHHRVVCTLPRFSFAAASVIVSPTAAEQLGAAQPDHSYWYWSIHDRSLYSRL